MSKTLTINTERPKKSYSLKGITNIKLVSDKNTFGTNVLDDMISDVKVDGKYLYVTMNMDEGRKGTLKFTNFSNLPNMTMQYADVNLLKGVLYDCLNAKISAKTVTEPIKGKVTGTMFDDVIDLYDSAYVAPTKGKNKDKGIIITGANGDDTFTGTKYNDKYTGGKGVNIINVFTQKVFGNDEIVLTKGENLEIHLADVEGVHNVSDYCEWIKDGKNLVITVYDKVKTEEERTVTGTLTVKNYFKKDVMTSSGSFKIVCNSREWSLRNNYFSIKMNSDSYTKSTYTGSWANESVTAKNYVVKNKSGEAITTETQGYEKVKGVTINFGTPIGKNTGRGSIYADTINGGNGKDEVWASAGNDKYNLKKGNNWIGYESDLKFDTDTITLTKGEILTIGMDEYGYKSVEEFKNDAKIKVSGKNLVIETKNGNIVLKNYAKSDVTGKNGNVRIRLVYEGSTNPEGVYINLKTAQVESGAGTWHNDVIDKSGYTNKKNKGLTINGKDGDDEITGSNYSDTIKGGAGDDTLNGGTGNDKLYGEGGKNTILFKSGDGKDTVYSGKGEDTLKFINASIGVISFAQGKGKNNKDLIIKYNDNENDSVTVKDYYKVDKKGRITGSNTKNSVKKLNVLEGTFNLSDLLIASGTINGNDNSNIIVGSADADVITGNKGNDTIYGFGGGDKYIFSTGDGEDIINYSTGSLDTIKFNNSKVEDMDFVRNGNDLEIHYGNNDVVTIKNYAECAETITVEDSTEKQYSLIHGWNNSSSVILSNNNHILVGTSSDDSIRVHYGENVFFGNNGRDELVGYNGSKNTYVIKSTNSSTHIYSEAGQDTIKFADLKLEDLTFVMSDDYAIIRYNGNTLVQISDYLKNGDMNIIDKEGATSTVSEGLGIIFGDGEHSVINGTENADIIVGTSIDETITGGKGHDTLYGMYGNNTYVFSKGDGNDVIYARIFADLDSRNDIIKFADSTMEELDFVKDLNDLRIYYNGGQDSIRVDGYFAPYVAGSKNNKVTKFMVKDDNTIYSIEEYNRHVIANDGETTQYTGTAINDIFTSSAIDEQFTGLEGKNTYNFTAGSIGTDTVITSSGKDIINFTNVEVGDLTFNINGDDVEITKDAEKIIIKDYMTSFPVLTVNGANSTSTTIAEELSAQGIITGSGVLNGTNEADTIIGSGTNDTITANKENDIINGGAGNDTYMFNVGDGDDILTYTSGNDIIKFNDAVVTEMDFVRNGDDIEIYYGTSDKLTLKNYASYSDSNPGTIKIEDSTETQYLLVKAGYGVIFTHSENNILVGTSSADTLRDDGGKNIYFGNGGGDQYAAYDDAENIYMIKKANNYTIYTDKNATVESTIKFTDTTFTDVSVEKGLGADYHIYYNDHHNNIKLTDMGGLNYTDYTLIDSTGATKKLVTDFGFISGSGDLNGTDGNNHLILTDNGTVSGFGGNDDICAHKAGTATVYTYKEGQKDTEDSTVSVYTGYGKATVYAQSAVNYIYGISGTGQNDNYFAYIDQKTYIQDLSGTADNLTLTNTNNATDGNKSNLHVLFNVSNTYTAEQGAGAIGNIIITDTATKANYDAWRVNDIGGDYTGISIKNNSIENIKSADNYTLVNTDIATLGQSVATWLSNNSYASVDGVFSNALKKSAEASETDITNLIEVFDSAIWH